MCTHILVYSTNQYVKCTNNTRKYYSIVASEDKFYIGVFVLLKFIELVCSMNFSNTKPPSTYVELTSLDTMLYIAFSGIFCHAWKKKIHHIGLIFRYT